MVGEVSVVEGRHIYLDYCDCLGMCVGHGADGGVFNFYRFGSFWSVRTTAERMNEQTNTHTHTPQWGTAD